LPLFYDLSGLLYESKQCWKKYLPEARKKPNEFEVGVWDVVNQNHRALFFVEVEAKRIGDINMKARNKGNLKTSFSFHKSSGGFIRKD